MVGMYPGMSPYMGYPQMGGYGGSMMTSMPYGSSQYGSGYGSMPQDNSSQMFSFCASIIQPLMSFLFSMIGPGISGSMPPDPSTVPPTDTGTTTGGSSGTTSGQQPPQNPTSNTEALQILSDYADQIPSMNNRVTKSNLDQLARGISADGSTVPDAVKQAAQMLSDNPELYNLMCLKSGNDPSKGINKDVFTSEGWQDFSDKVDLDNLETFDSGSSGDADAMKILDQNKDAIDKMGSSTGDGTITIDDLKKIAMGDGPGNLDDPKIQAAALRVLSNPDLQNELDGEGETDDAKKTDGNLQVNAFADYLNSNGESSSTSSSSSSSSSSGSGSAFTYANGDTASTDKNQQALTLLQGIMQRNASVQGVDYSDGLDKTELDALKNDTSGNVSDEEKAAINYLEATIQDPNGSPISLWDAIDGQDGNLTYNDLTTAISSGDLDPNNVRNDKLATA